MPSEPSPSSLLSADDNVEDAIPVVKWKAKMPSEPSPSSSLSADDNAGDAIPVVKWKAKMPSEPSPPSSLSADDNAGDTIPVVKWKAKVPDEPSPSSLSADDDITPSRKWKVRQVPSENHHNLAVNEEEMAIADVVAAGGTHRRGRPAQTRRQDGEDVPVVKWKAKMPPDQDSSPSSDDVPVVKWKAKVPQETAASEKRAKMPPAEVQGSDVPVVKWKARMPGDNEEPAARRKAKVPEDSGGSDVPVVKWKAKARVPEDSNVPVVRSKVLEDVQSPDVPVIKWKGKTPREGNAPVIRRKAKMPEEPGSQASDVPIVKWKAKMPDDSQSPNSFAMRKKAKGPAVNHQAEDVPVARWKAKMPAENGQPFVKKRAKPPEDQTSDVPIVKWKAKMPHPDNEIPNSRLKVASSSAEGLKQNHSSLSPKGYRSPRKVAAMPSSRSSEDVAPHSRSQRNTSPPTPPHSPVSSSTQLPQDEPAPSKPLSRRSSFSESRSPSPPSISPQVRMAIASPILSRRTPSPSRSLTSSLSSLTSRQSPVASPVMQRRQLQYIGGGGGQQSPGTSRLFTGAPSPIPGGHVSRIRTPRSQSAVNSPLKGLTPPGERKHRRVLPSGPSSESVGRNRSNQSTPTGRR